MSARSPDPTDKHVGSRVRLLRLMRRVSQTELGNQVGVTFQQIQKYENGTNRIGSGRLNRIAGVLGAPVSFFFEGHEGHEEPAAAAGEFSGKIAALLSDRENIELLRAFSRIESAELRRAILEMARAAETGASATAPAPPGRSRRDAGAPHIAKAVTAPRARAPRRRA